MPLSDPDIEHTLEVIAFAQQNFDRYVGIPVPKRRADPSFAYWVKRMATHEPPAPIEVRRSELPKAAAETRTTNPPLLADPEPDEEDAAWRAAAEAREAAEAQAWRRENDPDDKYARRWHADQPPAVQARYAKEAAERARTHRYGDTLRPLDASAFLKLSLPRREMLLDPVLPERGLAMLYAPRGVGKTWAALALGLAVATGGPFLRWRAERPRRVLYLDGEMRAEDMQYRLRLLMSGLDRRPEPDVFRIACADQLEVGLPDLASREGQAEIDCLTDESDLIILDNLSALIKGNENEQERWTPVQDWCLAQRRAGRSVLLVHHAGKSGQQRGTSRREDALDLVLALRRPEGAQPGEGARVEVHLEKCRGAVGEALNPVEARLETAGESAGWSWRELPQAEGEVSRAADGRLADPAKKAVARELLLQGTPVKQAARAAGLSSSTVHKMRQDMSAAGLFDASEEGGRDA